MSLINFYVHGELKFENMNKETWIKLREILSERKYYIKRGNLNIRCKKENNSLKHMIW